MNALPFSLLTATALILTGCGAPAETAKQALPSSPSQSPSASTLNKDTVPLLTTCLSLFGEGTSSLANESIGFLKEVKSIDAKTARKADSFATRFAEVAETAKPELAEPLHEMQILFEDFVQAWKDSGSWSVGDSYAAAKAAVVDVCTPELDAADEPAPSAAPAVTDDEKFLKALRTAHPAMKSTDTANQLEIAKIFCDVYDKGVQNGKVAEAAAASDALVTAPAGIKFTLEELKSIRKLGVSTFCPQHLDKVP